jgi:adenylate cyclase
MGADEAGTLATLRRCREAMATLIERHDGRIVNTWGDAVIAEFTSVVEAVQCAVETQQELSSHNGGLPEPQRMRFRIGINLGDVMVDGDDVYGIRTGAQQTVHRVRLPRPAALEERRQSGDGLSRPSRRRALAATGVAARGDEGSPAPAPRVESAFSRAWDWYTRLPRVSAVLIAIAVFLFVVNMFSGPRHIWFHWPVAVLLLIAVLRATRGSRPS